MPRSPAEGAATRSVADLEVGDHRRPTRDRRVRAGADRRQHDVGPPNGIERRRVDRRSHDRRSGMRGDRRRGDRRGASSRRAVADHRVEMSRRTQAARVASRSYRPEQLEVPGTPRLLRLVFITLVAVACLLAATLTGPVEDAGAAAAGSVKAKGGGVTATLTYDQRKVSGSLRRYTKLRLTVRAAGRTTLKSVKVRGEALESFGLRPRVSVAEVTGDGIPDAIVEVYTGGAHCCTVSAIAPSTPTGWGKLLVRNWADFGFELKDLGGTPQAEFKAWDARFTGAYGPYAASQTPVQVMRLQNGEFVDVTREFPEWIQQDVTDKAKAWQSAGSEDDAELRGMAGRAAAAAWIADLLQLGDTAAAKAVVEASTARGDFSGEGAAFPGQLGHDLKVWGYLTDPGVIGLTDAPATPAA